MTADSAKPGGPWGRHAQQWQLIGPPLRPGAADTEAAERAVAGWHGSRGEAPIDALVLGATPEFATMRWPQHARVLAVDRSLAMLRSQWPSGMAGRHAACAEWAALPLADATRDVVAGDGSFNALACAGDYPGCAAELRRVMRRAGLLVLRFFVRPPEPENPDTVFDELHSGRIGNFHIFKWRLAMALHHRFDEGVRLRDIWDEWRRAVPDPAELALRLDWPLPVVNTVDAYRGVDARYTFPTLEEARAALSPFFVEQSCAFPPYELGERCPTLSFRPAP